MKFHGKFWTFFKQNSNNAHILLWNVTLNGDFQLYISFFSENYKVMLNSKSILFNIEWKISEKLPHFKKFNTVSTLHAQTNKNINCHRFKCLHFHKIQERWRKKNLSLLHLFIHSMFICENITATGIIWIAGIYSSIIESNSELRWFHSTNNESPAYESTWVYSETILTYRVPLLEPVAPKKMIFGLSAAD